MIESVDIIINKLNEIAKNKYESFRNIIILKDSIYLFSENTISSMRVKGLEFPKPVFIPIGNLFEKSVDTEIKEPIKRIQPDCIFFISKKELLDFIRDQIKTTPARLNKSSLVIECCDNSIFLKINKTGMEVSLYKEDLRTQYYDGIISVNLLLLYNFLISGLIDEMIEIKIMFGVGISLVSRTASNKLNVIILENSKNV